MGAIAPCAPAQQGTDFFNTISPNRPLRFTSLFSSNWYGADHLAG